MTFDDWMRTRDAKYSPTDDTVALRELRQCWEAAQQHGDEVIKMKQLLRDLLNNGLGIAGHRVTFGADYYQCGACRQQTEVQGYADAIGEFSDVEHSADCGLRKLAEWSKAFEY